ncbi:MAG: hypothetical protein HOA29_11330 [Rhodobacteraceae bacterium]|nr:hypothetical protein [Paracoccaceae bacterium]MBT4230867.1 hypothetical protein [Paracoccaceae bacterium]MBT5853292.1 hypothetical protein [Paracoccaceae bacterium]MBT6897841.1 hypothetical protein [Paracoccaceae bacterium]MBT7416522.1 hypothetical protein [Paracoccaceae bacterium]
MQRIWALKPTTGPHA